MATFQLYPAIDILQGKCVRLLQGDYERKTVFHEQPVEVAKEWVRQGAEWIHVVDLDGAKTGRPVNAELIREMVEDAGVPIQLGGGLRTAENVERMLSAGVARVILGTAALENREFVEEMVRQHGAKIAVGIDARNGYVATRGWLETSEVKAEDLARQLAGIGVETFIFTDISRDGMMQGPNVEAIVRLAQASGQTVIASGGVSSYADLETLAAHAADGVGVAIIGKALYTGDIKLEQALRLGEGK